MQTQAVFALKGKPLNTYGLSKKVIYENEEFHLLQSALNIEEGLDGLRYARIVIATDADVDGMHIRLLLISFFLQYFPELIARRPPLHPRDAALPGAHQEGDRLLLLARRRSRRRWPGSAPARRSPASRAWARSPPASSRISSATGMRLEPVTLAHLHDSDELLSFFMGKNTPERQDFIIDNLRVEKDLVEA